MMLKKIKWNHYINYIVIGIMTAVLGVVESISYTITAIAPYTDAIEFSILIIILLVRPTGFLGKKRREKV